MQQVEDRRVRNRGALYDAVQDLLRAVRASDSTADIKGLASAFLASGDGGGRPPAGPQG